MEISAVSFKVDQIFIEEDGEESRESTISDKDDDIEVFEFDNDPEMSKKEKDF
jgi:hypothetical protein